MGNAFHQPDAATTFDIEECIVRFQEIAERPAAGAYLLAIASRARTALDQVFGPGNGYTARLIQIVMADLRSAREDVPPTVAQAVLPLLRQVATACIVQPVDATTAALDGRRRTDAACPHAATRLLRNAGRRTGRRAADVVARDSLKPWPMDPCRQSGGPTPRRRACDTADLSARLS